MDLGTRLIWVILTLREFELCCFVACRRNADAILTHADEEKYGFSGDNLDSHLTGCLGECAFAKGMNRYWTGAGVGWLDDDDVGDVQVRATKHDHGRLLVRPHEQHLDAKWVLVTGNFPHFCIRGWIYGHEAHHEQFLDSPAGRPPAYFVPQSHLRAIRDPATR